MRVSAGVSTLVLAMVATLGSGCAGGAVSCPEQRQLSATTRVSDAGDTLRVILSMSILEVRGGSQQITLNVAMGLPADTVFADVHAVRVTALTDTATVYATVPVGPGAGGACCAVVVLPEGTIPTDAFSSGQLQVTLVTNIPGLTFAPARLLPTVIGLWARPC